MSFMKIWGCEAYVKRQTSTKLEPKSQKCIFPAEKVTWELFKQSFKAKYVGASYVDERRKEFLNLTQCGKTVVEYEAEFLRLSRYASGIVSTEYERMFVLRMASGVS